MPRRFTFASRVHVAFALVLLAGFVPQEAASKDAEKPAGEGAAGSVPDQAVFVSGARMNSPNGVNIGPDGLLYVVSVLGSEITVLDPDTGEVKKRLGRAEGVSGPDDLTFGPDGTLYFTSITAGEVIGLRPDGRRDVVAKLTPGVNPITFSDDGRRLFVAQCFLDDKLYEIDPAGTKPPRLIRDDLGPHCGLNGMDWGPDNRLYGPRWFRGEVVSIDVDTGDMRTVASGFQVPAAVKFDHQKRLHVLEAAGKLYRVDGNEKVLVAELSPGMDNFVFDGKGRVFVSNNGGAVTRIDPDGTRKVLIPDGLTGPGGITVLTRGGKPEVVVADAIGVRGFDAATGQQTFAEANIVGISELGTALTVAPDGERLIVSAWAENEVRVWDPVTKKVTERHGELGEPTDALRYEGRIVVSEHANRRVIALDGENKIVLAAGLGDPMGLAVRDDELFVADRERGQVLRIAKAGKALPAPEIVAEGLDTPEGLAAAADGLVVVEAGSGRVTWQGSDGRKQALGEVTPGSPPLAQHFAASNVFQGVTVAPDGAIYVTDESKRTVSRIVRAVSAQ